MAPMPAHPQLAIYALLFVVSFAASLLLTPLTIGLAKRIGAVDYPTERKIHVSPIPRLGGLGVVAAVALTIAVGALLNRYIWNGLPLLRGMLAGSVLIIAIGVYDDIRNASPGVKLLVHMLAAGLAVALGVRFDLASNPLADRVLDSIYLGIFAVPLTMLWIVVLTNAMNLIDGLDGLASGISMFASVALFLISIEQKAGIVTYMYVIMAGATLAFLKYGRHPARVFLGDTGSTFLGFTLACLSVEGTHKSYTLTALFIPLIVFGIPLFDSIVTLFRRYFTGTRFFGADRLHIHHQLLAAGLDQKQVVWILYGITIVLGILGFTFTVLHDEYAAVIVVIIGVLGGFLANELNVFGTRRRAMEREYRVQEMQEKAQDR